MKFPSLKQLFSRELKDRIVEMLSPYRDVIIFMITLLLANYFWKFTVHGDEDGEMVTWLGLNITAPFDMLSHHIAAVVYWLVDLFRDTVTLIGGERIQFDSGSGTSIVWSCSGLKQSFIWMMLILTVLPAVGCNQPLDKRRLWWRKLWYIPLGWVCCYLFNIFRIFLIAILIEYHPEWFHVLHWYIFKYLFYAMLFGLWVIFVEKIRPFVSSN